MSVVSIPIERLVFGNEHWRSNRAIDEIEVYCDLLDCLQKRIDALTTRGKGEEVTLANVEAVISSYAMEIGIKSLWALDNPMNKVPTTHNLIILFNRLSEGTVDSLNRFHLTKKVLEDWPQPFLSNRYSMESGSRDIAVYMARFLRSLVQLLKDKLEETRRMVLRPP